MRGLLIGRFQPFHKGHFEVIKEIASQVDKLIIGIGSAQKSHTLDDPFTAGERHLMVSESLNQAGIDNYYLIPIVDIHRYSVWVAHVKSLVPPFDAIYTNNDLTARLFREAGIEVRRPTLYDRDKHSGRSVRQAMVEDGDWQSLVPQGTIMVMEEIDGANRVKELAGEVQ